MIYVHNITRGEYDPSNPRHIYIGRSNPRRRLAGSPLGNPFKVRHEGDRAQAVEQFRVLLRFILNPQPMSLNEDGQAVRAEFERLRDLARTGDLHLYCWCKPDACHGDVIREFLEATP